MMEKLPDEALRAWQSQAAHLIELGVDTVSLGHDGGFYTRGIESIVEELLDTREKLAKIKALDRCQGLVLGSDLDAILGEE